MSPISLAHELKEGLCDKAIRAVVGSFTRCSRLQSLVAAVTSRSMRRPTTRRRPRRVTASAAKSYLVSFTGGSIPSNAAALISAAGGSIAARYNAVGARAREVVQRLVRRHAARGRRHRRRRRRRLRPQRHRRGAGVLPAPLAPLAPRRRQRSAVVPAVGHGSDPLPAGPRHQRRQEVGAGRRARLRHRRQPPRSRPARSTPAPASPASAASPTTPPRPGPT